MKILVCVTGSIACYKAVELVRLLKKADCLVKVVMSEASKRFIQPLTFASVSGEKVYDRLFDESDIGSMAHIELARWADVIVIAPATANTIAKLAAGFADDLMANIILASESLIILAPAMNKVMWKNPAVQQNLSSLKARGHMVIPPDEGAQACGEVGDGRLAEPEVIARKILTCRQVKPKQSGGVVVITAGPTVEAIDPVRFISNHSSGKTGYALAACFAKRGWHVILISGPTALKTPENVRKVDVKSADKMYQEVQRVISGADMFIAAAAVADFKTAKLSSRKLKKSHDKGLSLDLVQNRDILSSVSCCDKQSKRPFCIGFAAETDHIIDHGLAKLRRKKLDMLVLNEIDGQTGFPFHFDQTSVYLYNRQGELLAQYFKRDKPEIAEKIADIAISEYHKKTREQLQDSQAH